MSKKNELVVEISLEKLLNTINDTNTIVDKKFYKFDGGRSLLNVPSIPRTEVAPSLPSLVAPDRCLLNFTRRFFTPSILSFLLVIFILLVILAFAVSLISGIQAPLRFQNAQTPLVGANK